MHTNYVHLMYSIAQHDLGGEHKITLFHLTKYDFATAYVETSVLLLLTGMHTRITVVDEKGL
jgi:hypothetical protein